MKKGEKKHYFIRNLKNIITKIKAAGGESSFSKWKRKETGWAT